MTSIFSKILSGEIPAKFLHRDNMCAAIHDIAPQAPVHVLIFPIKEIENVGSAEEIDQEILGHMLLVAGSLAKKLGVLDSGFRLVMNNGKHGGQSVDHLHIHLLAGRQLEWPPG